MKQPTSIAAILTRADGSLERGSRIDGVIHINAQVFILIDDAASRPWTRIFVWDAPNNRAARLEAPIGGTLTLEAL